MNAKRILPWKEIRGQWHADCLWDSYWIVPHLVVAGRIATYQSVRCGGNEIPTGIGTRPTLDEALAACEADYISRCTEFLTLYNPSTHVCVSRECAKTALVMLSGSGNVLSFDRDDAETELRAALEVKS